MDSYKVWTLASGSSGNSVYFEAEDAAILVDAGISAKAVDSAIAAVGGESSKLKAIFLTHSHSDHIRGAGVVARKFGVPVYATRATYEYCASRLGRGVEYRIIRTSESVEVGGFTVSTLPTPHDAEDSVAFILERGGSSCGVLTDLGHVFYKLEKVISDLDGVILESNYDPLMLETGSYPYYLKQRISSKSGHISNEQAAYLLLNSQGSRLKTVLLAHLSQENNTPEQALKCHREVLADSGKDFRLMVAPRSEPSEPLCF